MTPEERRARELRLIGREAREDEEWSAAELDAAQQSLAGACHEMAVSGHDVVVDTIVGSHRGRIVHVGEDVLGLASVMRGRIDVALTHAVGISGSRRPGPAATVSTGHPRTFVARMREAAQNESIVALERIDGSVVHGRVTAVAAEHVLVEEGEDHHVIPTAGIVSIAPA